MGRNSLLLLSATLLFSGCQACSDCTDYSPPVATTAPGEIYAGTPLPAGNRVTPQNVPQVTELQGSGMIPNSTGPIPVGAGMGSGTRGF